MTGGDTQVALVINRNTGEHCVGIAHGFDGGRVVEACFDPATARAIAADLLKFADDCEAANARAAGVAAQLIEKLKRVQQEGA